MAGSAWVSATVSDTLTSLVETMSTGQRWAAKTSQMALRNPCACNMRVETTSTTATRRLVEMHLNGVAVRGARVVTSVPVRSPSGGPGSQARELSTHTGTLAC